MQEIADEVRSVLRAATRSGPRSVRLAHGRRLRLSGKTLVMGVVNVTPDSFFDGGRYASTDDAVRHGLRLVEEGADLLDIGGESTRPGSAPVPVREELRRVLPVLRSLRARSHVPLSVDTSKPEVAREALRNGAGLVNDVSGLGDRRMREVVRRAGAAAVVMHMRGRPRDMQADTRYDDLLAEVFAELAERTARAEREGIASDQLVVDPGVGFGKSFEGNLELLRRLGEFRSLGYPVMVGASRKSFLGALLGGAPPEHRGEASVTAAVLASLRGASIVRVHDVGPTKEALRVSDAFRRGWPLRE